MDTSRTGDVISVFRPQSQGSFPRAVAAQFRYDTNEVIEKPDDFDMIYRAFPWETGA
jgi:hypothetical protein